MLLRSTSTTQGRRRRRRMSGQVNAGDTMLRLRSKRQRSFLRRRRPVSCSIVYCCLFFAQLFLFRNGAAVRTATTLIAPSLLLWISNAGFLPVVEGYCNWGPDGTASTSVCSGGAQGGTWCNANADQCKTGCGGRWCGDTVPTTSGFCNWGPDGTASTSVCQGGAQGGSWCNANADQCKTGCGGKWCTQAGAPAPAPTPAPAPAPTSSGFCNWGPDGTASTSVCSGGAQGGTWCNANADQCKTGCGGKWCTQAGAPAPTPAPAPAPAPTSSVCVDAPETNDDGIITAYRQDFENLLDDTSMWGEGEDVIVKSGTGYDGSKGIVITYRPDDRGSPRLTGTEKIPGRTEYTLSYDILFVEPFDFKRGGKIHGLGGGRITTGCDGIVPDGWTVRLMWIESGMIEMYLYDQERTERCGRAVMTWYYLPVDEWVHIDLYVKVNSVGKNDGTTSLYVNGEHIMTVDELKLRGDTVQDNSVALVDTFLFSTFYGGSDSSWSPDFTTQSRMDNIFVREGCRD